MQHFKADLHTHTVLSPCGSLEMAPMQIIDKACEQNIDLLGITDHNSTLMCKIMHQAACEKGIAILPGAEVTTKEEVHCLAFFETWDQLDEFQKYLDAHLPPIKNDPTKFGYQVIVNQDEEILDEKEFLLISALDQSIEQVEAKVHELGGLFIPAHIDRTANGLIAQLGFIPPGIKADAMELSKFTTFDEYVKMQPILTQYPVIRSSDAHFIDNIGDATTVLYMNECSFDEFKKALENEGERKVIVS
ncbi:MAG: PHP-associated domain-containing protein [Salinivirgaceae bacterium]